MFTNLFPQSTFLSLRWVQFVTTWGFFKEALRNWVQLPCPWVFGTIRAREQKNDSLSGKRLTTVRLLFMGWKVQQRSSLDSGSLTSRMHRPSSVFQIRRVPSNDVETMMSLLRDQAKSVTGPPWPFRVTFTLGGGGDRVMMERVPSNEQHARRCLSSLANCNRGTIEGNDQ